MLDAKAQYRYGVPAGTFDDAAGDRPAFLEGGGVVEVGALVQEVVGGAVGLGALGVGEVLVGRFAADRGRGLPGLAVQDGECLVLDPRLGGGVALLEEAPRGGPEVLQDVHDVDHDRDLDLALLGFGFDAVDLVVVAVHEHDPSALVGRVATLGLIEDVRDHACGVIHHRRGQPLPRRLRRRERLRAARGEHVRGGAGRWHDVVNRADLSDPLAIGLLSLGEAGCELR